jgi:ribonuclease-3
MDSFIEHHDRRLAELEANLGFTFQDRRLLRQAITHKSFTNENPSLNLRHNEALEFLGDSVLNFTVSTRLYDLFAGYTEGELSRFRSHLVSGQHLVSLARKLDLGHFILLGRGEQKTGGEAKPNILTDTLEAVIGAIYLDRGIRPARAFVHRIFAESLRRLQRDDFLVADYKTRLQEHLADAGRLPPRYVKVSEEGPDHDKVFCMQIDVGGEFLGEGQGRSKKEAQQAAAQQALENLARRDGGGSEEWEVNSEQETGNSK